MRIGILTKFGERSYDLADLPPHMLKQLGIAAEEDNSFRRLFPHAPTAPMYKPAIVSSSTKFLTRDELTLLWRNAIADRKRRDAIMVRPAPQPMQGAPPSAANVVIAGVEAIRATPSTTQPTNRLQTSTTVAQIINDEASAAGKILANALPKSAENIACAEQFQAINRGEGAVLGAAQMGLHGFSKDSVLDFVGGEAGAEIGGAIGGIPGAVAGFIGGQIGGPVLVESEHGAEAAAQALNRVANAAIGGWVNDAASHDLQKRAQEISPDAPQDAPGIMPGEREGGSGIMVDDPGGDDFDVMH
jgi:hypothetical protein